jgi:hypothetical protein
MVYLTAFTVGSSLKYFFGSEDLINVSDGTFGSLFLGLIFQIVLFCILTIMILRGVTTRKGWFASFRMLVLALIGIGILLSWQISMTANVGIELEAMTGTDSSNLAGYLPFFIYFMGVVIMIAVFIRNRRDIKRWFPSKA